MNNFRSKFETKTITPIQHLVEYEPIKVEFTVPESKHTYCPDVVYQGTWYELKGKLDAATRKKMLWIKASYPKQVIVFVFQNGNVKLSKTSKTTYEMWARKNGFEVMTPKQFQEIVLHGQNDD